MARRLHVLSSHLKNTQNSTVASTQSNSPGKVKKANSPSSSLYSLHRILCTFDNNVSIVFLLCTLPLFHRPAWPTPSPRTFWTQPWASLPGMSPWCSASWRAAASGRGSALAPRTTTDAVGTSSPEQTSNRERIECILILHPISHRWETLHLSTLMSR